jgi:hypothetical protein
MLSRRQAIGLLAGAAPALKLARAAGESLEIAPGPFKGTRIAERLAGSRVVPRRQIRYLGALGTAIRR